MLVGVFGDEESCADSGESSRISLESGGRSVCPDTDRLVARLILDAGRGPRSLLVVPSSGTSTYGVLNAVDLTKVAWLEVLDFVESLDLSSVADDGLGVVDKRDRDPSSPFTRDELAPRLLPSRLVSGGLGGRSVLCEGVFFTESKSADLDRLISSLPMSVASGVGGPVPVPCFLTFPETVETSSLLRASLL